MSDCIGLVTQIRNITHFNGDFIPPYSSDTMEWHVYLHGARFLFFCSFLIICNYIHITIKTCASDITWLMDTESGLSSSYFYNKLLCYLDISLKMLALDKKNKTKHLLNRDAEDTNMLTSGVLIAIVQTFFF